MDSTQEQANNEFDTLQDEADLKALDEEIAQASESLESDFAKFAASKMDEKMEELFFENKEDFFKQILLWQNEFLEAYRNKLQRRQGLQNNIATKRRFKSIQEAQDAFEANNPDVDMSALMEFYAQDLSPRIKAELDKSEPHEFFNLLYQYFLQAQTQPEPDAKEDNALPARLEGASANVSNDAPSDELITNRY